MRLAGVSCLVALAVAVHGCVDTSPVDYRAPIDDGGLSAGDAQVEGGLIRACGDCMATSCADGWTACHAEPRCAAAADCWLERYCYNIDTANLANLPACFLECAAKADIRSQDDPVVPQVAVLVRCAQRPEVCGPVCNVK